MRAEAIGVEHEEERRSGVTDRRNRATGRLVHLGHVRRVQLGDLDAERRAAPGDRARELELDRRRLRVVVVLDDEENGELPERRHVQGLVRDPLTECSVAKEHRRDRARALLLLRERDSGRDRDDAPEHAVGVEVAAAEVLAPALAAARAGRLAHDLAEQAEGVVREREVVPVAAVVREDDVALGIEVIDDPDRVRLLSDVGVRRPDELALREQVEKRLLEAPDEVHPRIERGEIGRAH
jgi:hypothetical protein